MYKINFKTWNKSCIAGSLILLLLLTGCGGMKESALTGHQAIPTAFEGQTDTTRTGLSWKELFSDQRLQELIDTAMLHNYELKTGLQRINVAEANLRLARSRRLPSVQADLSAGLDKFGKYTIDGVGNYDTNFSPNIDSKRNIPDPTGNFFAGFRSSWELDIWGKLNKRKQAAFLRYLASKEGQRWYQTQLVSQVALLYFELLTLDKEAHILKQNIKLQEKGVEIIEAQLAGGRATALAVSQFRAQLMGTKGRAYEIRQSQKETENELNTLMGRYPVKIARDTNTLNVAIPQRLHTGLPSTVLLSRPDIREAELELKAAKADIYAARKAMLPTLTLTAYSGYNAFKLPLLFSPGSLASGFLGGLTAPILNRAAIKTEFSQANSAQLNAYYNYQQKLLQGYQEVSTQLSAMDNYHQAMLLKESQVKELKEALSTANDLYLAGYASYLEVIVAQGSVLDAEVEFVRMKKASGTALINLFRSIGGV